MTVSQSSEPHLEPQPSPWVPAVGRACWDTGPGVRGQRPFPASVSPTWAHCPFPAPSLLRPGSLPPSCLGGWALPCPWGQPPLLPCSWGSSSVPGTQLGLDFSPWDPAGGLTSPVCPSWGTALSTGPGPSSARKPSQLRGSRSRPGCCPGRSWWLSTEEAVLSSDPALLGSSPAPSADVGEDPLLITSRDRRVGGQQILICDSHRGLPGREVSYVIGQECSQPWFQD